VRGIHAASQLNPKENSMKIQLTLAEATRILSDKLGSAVLRGDATLDACVTVEIVVPVPLTVPVSNGNGYFNKISAIRALRDDFQARKEYLGLAEAKRLVELVHDTGNAKPLA
jgi:hypothetical protein